MMPSVICDFGNVIAFFDHRRACRAIAALASNNATEDTVHSAIFDAPIHAEFDCGELSSAEFVECLRAKFCIKQPDSDIVSAWCDIFSPNDALTKWLPMLKRSAKRLHLASNTDALHFDWIRQHFRDVTDLFDGFTLSFEVGVRKPSLAFYQHCVTVMDVSPTECIFVDDRKEFVDVARSIGMVGITYQSHMDLREAFKELGFASY
jgi:putative hydrolase of the HAD superfamily